MKESGIQMEREGMRWRERAGREGRREQGKEGKRPSYDGRERTEIIMENLLNYWSLLRTNKDTPAYVDPNLTVNTMGSTCSRTSKQQSIVNSSIC